MPNSNSSKKKKKGGGEADGPAADGWLTTYCDLCTLLLTFFVLLLSMSVLDDTRKKEALNSLVGAFGFLPGGRTAIGTPKGMDISEFSSPMEEDESFDFDLLREVTMKNELDKKVELIKKADSLTIVLNQKILFEPGSYVLKEPIRKYLAQLAPYLKKQDKEIDIRGHTDRFEQVNRPYWARDSWVISTKRAMAVYHYLQQLGIPTEKMSVHGFSFYEPLVDGRQFPHLRYKNQRVEIVIGYSRVLPASLMKEKPKPTPYFNYKNFFFRLFPMEPKKSKSRISERKEAIRHPIKKDSGNG